MKRYPRWKMWRLQATSRTFRLLTPWFGILISDKGQDWATMAFWSGYELWWQYNADGVEGETIFNRYIHREWFRQSRELYRDMGGYA
jgi:hypothetical protein